MNGEMNEIKEKKGMKGKGKMEGMKGGMQGMKGKGKMKGGCKGHGKDMDGKHGRGMEKTEYAYVRAVETGFDETVERVKKELKKEGFGVLSEVRVDLLFKEKLGLEMEPYVILGACNPELLE